MTSDWKIDGHNHSGKIDRAGRLDRVAGTGAFICAIHCGAMPLLVAVLPVIGLSWFASEWTEWALFTLSACVGCFSLFRGYRKHRKIDALRVLAAGVCVLFLGRIGDMEHWAPYYLFFLVAGGCIIASSHWINSRLCGACRRH